MSVVKGISVYAQVTRPGQYGDYNISLVVDNATKQKLEKEGLKAKPAESIVFKDGSNAGQYGPWIFKFKQRMEGEKGTFPAPKVLDADLNPFEDLVGNGSLVNVQYRAGEWKFGGRKGVAAYLEGVQILNLVPYEKKVEFQKETQYSETTSAPDVDEDESPFDES